MLSDVFSCHSQFFPQFLSSSQAPSSQRPAVLCFAPSRALTTVQDNTQVACSGEQAQLHPTQGTHMNSYQLIPRCVTRYHAGFHLQSVPAQISTRPCDPSAPPSQHRLHPAHPPGPLGSAASSHGQVDSPSSLLSLLPVYLSSFLHVSLLSLPVFQSTTCLKLSTCLNTLPEQADFLRFFSTLCLITKPFPISPERMGDIYPALLFNFTQFRLYFVCNILQEVTLSSPFSSFLSL